MMGILRRWWASEHRAFVLDVLLAASVGIISIFVAVRVAEAQGETVVIGAIGLLVLQSLALAVRRRWPMAVYSVVGFGTVGPPLRVKEHPLMTDALLAGRNLRKTYRLSRRNSVEALRGVDVTIQPGEMVAIMGPSGSGKSTLMHILGLLHAPDRNDGAGPELQIGGTDVTRLSDRDRTRTRASSMGFVFQSFNLVPTLTAEENVALAGEYAGSSRGKARSAAREALDWVGLADRATHRPMELSGGEQQRVSIARALVNEPMLMMGDEPTGNLDSGRSAEVLALLRRFNRERGQTVILVTHDAEVGAFCDRILRMRDALIVADERAVILEEAAA